MGQVLAKNDQLCEKLPPIEHRGTGSKRVSMCAIDSFIVDKATRGVSESLLAAAARSCCQCNQEARGSATAAVGHKYMKVADRGCDTAVRCGSVTSKDVWVR